MSPDRGDDNAHESGTGPQGLSRRNFLRRGTLTAAAVAVTSSVPGISTLIATTAADGPAVDTGVSDAADTGGALTEPLVAQVKDLSTGEISLFQGEREIVVHSPGLARSLMSAARP